MTSPASTRPLALALAVSLPLVLAASSASAQLVCDPAGLGGVACGSWLTQVKRAGTAPLADDPWSCVDAGEGELFTSVLWRNCVEGDDPRRLLEAYAQTNQRLHVFGGAIGLDSHLTDLAMELDSDVVGAYDAMEVWVDVGNDLAGVDELSAEVVAVDALTGGSEHVTAVVRDELDEVLCAAHDLSAGDYTELRVVDGDPTVPADYPCTRWVGGAVRGLGAADVEAVGALGLGFVPSGKYHKGLVPKFVARSWVLGAKRCDEDDPSTGYLNDAGEVEVGCDEQDPAYTWSDADEVRLDVVIRAAHSLAGQTLRVSWLQYAEVTETEDEHVTVAPHLCPAATGACSDVPAEDWLAAPGPAWAAPHRLADEVHEVPPPVVFVAPRAEPELQLRFQATANALEGKKDKHVYLWDLRVERRDGASWVPVDPGALEVTPVAPAGFLAGTNDAARLSEVVHGVVVNTGAGEVDEAYPRVMRSFGRGADAAVAAVAVKLNDPATVDLAVLADKVEGAADFVDAVLTIRNPVPWMVWEDPSSALYAPAEVGFFQAYPERAGDASCTAAAGPDDGAETCHAAFFPRFAEATPGWEQRWTWELDGSGAPYTFHYLGFLYDYNADPFELELSWVDAAGVAQTRVWSWLDPVEAVTIDVPAAEWRSADVTFRVTAWDDSMGYRGKGEWLEALHKLVATDGADTVLRLPDAVDSGMAADSPMWPVYDCLQGLYSAGDASSCEG